MNLPIPTPAQIGEFKQIYLEEFGVELTPEEAWETATITLQLFYLSVYGLKVKPPEAVASTGSSAPSRSRSADLETPS